MTCGISSGRSKFMESSPPRAAVTHRAPPSLKPTPPPARPNAISNRLSPRVNALLSDFPADVAEDLVCLLLLPNGVDSPNLVDVSTPRRAPPLPPSLSDLEQMSVRAAALAATALERLQRPVKHASRVGRRRPPARPHSAQPPQQTSNDLKRQARPATASAAQRHSSALTGDAEWREEAAAKHTGSQQPMQEQPQGQPQEQPQEQPQRQEQTSLSVTPIMCRALAEKPCAPPPTPRVTDLLHSEAVTALWSARPPHRLLAAPPAEVQEAAKAFDGLHGQRLTQADSIHRAVYHDPSGLRTRRAFDLALTDVRLSRYHLEEKLVVSGLTSRRGPSRRMWRLEDSIWKPRPRTCDSKDFYDTPQCVPCLTGSPHRGSPCLTQCASAYALAFCHCPILSPHCLSAASLSLSLCVCVCVCVCAAIQGAFERCLSVIGGMQLLPAPRDSSRRMMMEMRSRR